MTKGKPQFADLADSDAGAAEEGSPFPNEASYQVAPTPARRQLTARDIEQNRKAERLFDRLIPRLPIDADPPELRREPEPFSAMIEKALKRLNIEASPWLDDLAQAWPTLVPADVAKVTRPGKWDAGILYVYVTTSVQLFEIRRTQLKRIEQAVRAFAGDDRVKHVRLMVNAVHLPFH